MQMNYIPAVLELFSYFLIPRFLPLLVVSFLFGLLYRERGKFKNKKDKEHQILT